MSLVKEHLNTILGNVVTNQKQIENAIAQAEQQISVQKEQLETIKTLVAGIEYLAKQDDSVIEIVVGLREASENAADAVNGSPTPPVAANSDEAAAGHA